MAGNCKFYKQERYVSFDSGQTWSGTSVYRKGALIESASTVCGYVPPHDYSTDYLTVRALGSGNVYWSGITDGTSANTLQYSTDSGSTWSSPSSEITVSVNSGDTVLFKGECIPSFGIGRFSGTTADFDVEGNVMSLLYGDNFSGQTSLSGKDSAFYNLFRACTTLQSAENLSLPATTLEYSCYGRMFQGCTSLTTAPSVLPATTLANNCCRYMFSGCTSLTTAPILLAAKLEDSCYRQMFIGCSNLSSITCLATIIPLSATDCTRDWVSGVAASGTFTTPSSTQWESGENGIPSGWIIRDVTTGATYWSGTTSGSPYCNGYDKYIDIYHQISSDSGSTWTTTATTPTLVEANSEYCDYVPPTPPTPSGDSRQYLTFRPNGDTEYWFSYGDSENYTSISYSLNSGSTWNVVEHNEHTVTVHSGDTIMWRGEAANLGSGIGTFHSSGGTWNAEGNVMSLLYFDNFSGQTTFSDNNVLRCLFSGCTGITSAENLVLPATTLTDFCYYGMFYRCTNLTKAPALPATTLAIWCYLDMFQNCSSLTTAPSLLATTLADYCYYGMFINCYSLTTAPTLLATTLVEGCYQSMFSDCTSLTTAPTLSATTLADGCYYYMFKNCNSLNSITCLATDISATNCTGGWLDGVASSGTFTTPSSTNWSTGTSGIPNGWTRVDI